MSQIRRQLYSEGEALRKLRLNGFNNNVIINNTEDIEYQITAGFTIAFNTIVESAEKYQPIISKAVSYSTSSTGANRSFSIYFDPFRNNSLVLEMFGIDYGVREVIIPYRLEANTEYSAAISYSFINGIIYYNINSFSGSTYIAPFTLNKSAVSMVIGDTYTSDTRPITQPYQGYISNISFWKEALNNQQLSFITGTDNKLACQLKSKGKLNFKSNNCLLYSTLNYTTNSPINLSSYSYTLALRGDSQPSYEKAKRAIIVNNKMMYTITREGMGYGYGYGDTGGINVEFLF